MSAVERAASSDPDWWIDQAAPVQADGYSTAEGDKAWGQTVQALGTLNDAVRSLSKAVVMGTRSRLEAAKADQVIAVAAMLQDLRADLARTEAWLVREVGRDEVASPTGVLPDGRPYGVLKGKERKAWDHDAWKHDARREVLSGVPERLIDPATGEAVDVPALLAAVQEVHGSGPPRTTALKALGLAPDDYCESVPGPWSLKIEKAADL